MPSGLSAGRFCMTFSRRSLRCSWSCDNDRAAFIFHDPARADLASSAQFHPTIDGDEPFRDRRLCHPPLSTSTLIFNRSVSSIYSLPSGLNSLLPFSATWRSLAGKQARPEEVPALRCFCLTLNRTLILIPCHYIIQGN